jgi:frataxin-like iron-binding protein CyaY
MADIECPKCKATIEMCGSHEDDEGDCECETCGFGFNVEIEYDPTYIVTCQTHQWDDWRLAKSAEGFVFRQCHLCDAVEARRVKE